MSPSRLLRGARRVGLLGPAVVVGVVVSACARPGTPPGGPPDRLPPLVVGTEPDTFATVRGGLATVHFRFSEKISERPSSGTLDQAVRVSPATGKVTVKHGSRSLDVSVAGGFRPGLVYRVTILPVISDLFQNTMSDPFELVFSTGGEFNPNVLAGRVLDRITGEPLEGVRVHVRSTQSTLMHEAVADSSGIFALRYLPPDQYILSAFQDLNRNDTVNFEEAQASRRLVIGATDTILMERVALLRPDTTPAILSSAQLLDSISLSLSFDDYLDPEVPLDGVHVDLTRVETPDTLAQDTLQQDTLIQDTLPQDTLPQDTLPQDTLPQDTARVYPTPSVLGVYHPWVLDSLMEARADSVAQAAGEEPSPPEENENEAPQERLPQQEARVLLGGPLEPGASYRVEVSGVTNIYGLPGGGGVDTVHVPAPEPKDTASAAPDSSAAAQDTSGIVPPDTSAATPPDTSTTTPPDTAVATPPDTSSAQPPDTTGTPPDTTATPPDTTAAPPDTSHVRLPGLRRYRRSPFRHPTVAHEGLGKAVVRAVSRLFEARPR